ncbi:MAG TPA: serine/threonine-protein kinase [Pyrinomonadaceae bacterium]
MRAMICATCQQPVLEGVDFCGNCGAPRANYDPRGAETIKQAPTTNDQLKQQTDDNRKSLQDPLVGLILDSKYQLLERLGEGGMGAVYRARRLHIGDDVAVKLLSRDLTRDQNAIERFRREARSAAMIRHPNVVSIHDFSEADEANHEAYIVMELVKGESLRKLIAREGHLTPARTVSLMRDVCAGVGVAHRQGLLHRDLKPDNIIVSSGSQEGEGESAKVVDFGLAKVRDAANVSALTQTGTLIGTLYYMSPEQCRAEELDARTDVYSLGAIVYEMLSGRPPFVSSNPVGLIAKHLNERPPDFAQSLGISPALAQVCFRALAKDREQRQADALKFADELQAAVAHGPKYQQTLAATAPYVPALKTRRTRNLLLWIIPGLLVFITAIGIASLILLLKFGWRPNSGNGRVNQNIQRQTGEVSNPSQTEGSESESTTTAATISDLRGTWAGTYGPLGSAATLVIKSHKGRIVEGELSQGPVIVAFTGTVDSGSINLKQTRVLRGDGWSLGEDSGTISADGKTISGTGTDTTGGPFGMSYQWTFRRH